MNPRQTRFSLAPLLDRIEPRTKLGAYGEPQALPHGCKQTTLARKAGVHRRQIVRWVREGAPYFAADRLAVAIGLHPLEVWPDWYEVQPLVEVA